MPTVTDCPRCRFPMLESGAHCPYCGVNTRRAPRAPIFATREQRWLAAGVVFFAAVAIAAIAAAVAAV